MIVHVFALLQAVSGQALPAPTQEIDRPVIWREFRIGMTPEQFSETLKPIDGIKSVEVVRKGKKPARVKIGYINDAGIAIGDMTLLVSPYFVKDQLESISLTQTSCFSTIEAKIEKLATALGEKYPNQQKIKMVDSEGVQIDNQRAFYNEESRVSVSASTIENPYPQHLYGGTGFMAAANKLANSIADSEYNSAIEACPADRGKKATVKLEYMSQAKFAQEHEKENAERSAKAKATMEGL